MQRPCDSLNPRGPGGMFLLSTKSAELWPSRSRKRSRIQAFILRAETNRRVAYDRNSQWIENLSEFQKFIPEPGNIARRHGRFGRAVI